MKWFLLNIGTISIDKKYIPVVQSCSWTLTNSGYIQGSGKYRHQLLHKIIAKLAGLDTSDDIDHIDRNKVNNQLSNLRSATRSQNNMNSKISSNNTTGCKGVSYNKGAQKYRAYINEIHLGYYDTAEEASKVREEVALKYYGEFARS